MIISCPSCSWSGTRAATVVLPKSDSLHCPECGLIVEEDAGDETPLVVRDELGDDGEDWERKR